MSDTYLFQLTPITSLAPPKPPSKNDKWEPPWYRQRKSFPRLSLLWALLAMCPTAYIAWTVQTAADIDVHTLITLDATALVWGVVALYNFSICFGYAWHEWFYPLFMSITWR